MEGSGRSELLDWHLLWLTFVVVNALLSSSDSPSLSSPSTRSLTFNFPSCMQMSVTFRFPVWNIIIVKKWIHWRTQVQHKNGMTTEKSGAGARCYHLLKKKELNKLKNVFSLRMSTLLLDVSSAVWYWWLNMDSWIQIYIQNLVQQIHST